MISAYLEIKGEEHQVDWADEVDLGLFHQICRLIDLVDGEKTQLVLFNNEDFIKIRNFLSSAVWYFVVEDDSIGISLILTIDGYNLLLNKQK